MTETEEGFLAGDAYVTRSGVFPYVNIDGEVYYQLRHPDDVFKQSSLDTMKMIPMTLEHPKELLDKDNTFWHQIGFLGENIRVAEDGKRIIAPYKITDPFAIDTIKEREKIEISMGYTLDLILENGNYDNIDYTHRQTNIRYNHAALVEKGRAGSDVKIILDSMACFDSINFDDYEIKNGGGTVDPKKMVTVQLDTGLSYDAAPEVKIALDAAIAKSKKLQDSLDSANTKKAELVKDNEKLKGNVDSLKADLEKAQNVNLDEKIQEGIKERSEIIEIAKKVLDAAAIKNIDSMGNSDLKIACIEAHRGSGYKINNDSQDFITGLWDGLLFSVNNDAKQRQIKTVIPTPNYDSGKPLSAEEARAKMMDSQESEHSTSNVNKG